MHLYDPHTPYEAPEPYRSLFPRNMDGAYDAEITYTDSQVGRLLDALELDGRTRVLGLVHDRSEHRQATPLVGA